jgi:putative membrane protein
MDTTTINSTADKAWLRLIIAVSFVVVAVVGFLIYKAQGISTYDPKIYFLPRLNAFLNGSVSVLLPVGYIFIRNKNIKAHRLCMVAAFIFSIVFLVSYITYHYNAPESRYGDLDHNGIVTDAEKLSAGALRYVYYIVLSTHILLSMVVVPMVLMTLYRIWKGQTAKHRKIARWTLPMWWYVSLTGVLVYFLISPYYPA